VIVVFDSQCLLCNSWVRFLLPRDPKGTIQFASMQGATGQALLKRAGLPLDNLDTLLVVDGERSWQHTAAILRVLHTLGGAWRAFWIFWLIPAPLRDTLYRLAARNRYRLFGRSEQCLMPRPEDSARFLP
jgi:predicted DCC family thiol-disulfide oxidoreductase YuxK